MIKIDKIPIELIQPSPGEESYKLGTLEIPKCEYANAEKINQLIDIVREIQEHLFKAENK